jgi:sugar phosphate isomerase/epimerase
MSSAYGVSLSLMAGLGRDEALALIAAAGFREIELPASPDVLGNWLAAPAATRRAVEAAGLRVRSVHTPPEGWFNAEPDEFVRQGSGRAASACLRPAAAVGAETVIWHANFHETPVARDEWAASRALSLDSLATFAARARELGLRVAVENTPELANPRPFTTVEDVLRLIAGFGPEVGVCLDAGHSRANDRDPAEEARLAGARLYAVHLQDNHGPGDDCHLIPERDMSSWDALAAALDALGYAGGRMFEIHPAAADGDFEEALARLASLARRWGRKTPERPEGAK